MSIKSKLATFFEKLKADAEAMWKKAPAIEIAAASAVNYTVPFVESLDEIITPEIAPILNPILDKIKTGLTAVKTTIQDAGSKPNLPSVISSVNENFGELISAAQVNAPASVAKFQAVETLVTGELNAILAELAPPPPPPATGTANTTTGT